MLAAKNIFKEYDIRGIYPDEINKDIAFELGAAFAAYARAAAGKKPRKADVFPNKIVAARDVRVSSAELHKAFIGGCVAAGMDVLDIGIATTPMLYFAVNLFKTAGGAIITASHNPPEYNGVKLALDGASPVSPSDIMPFTTAPIKAKSKGRVEKMEVASAYVDFLVSYSKLADDKNFMVVADASNGAGGPLIKSLFEKIKVSYWPLFFDYDGRFPNHSPNPLEKSAQQHAKETIIHRKADWGFLLDADGDRVVFLDENGKNWRGDYITALLVDRFVEDGSTVVVDTATSRVVFDVGMAKNINVIRSRTGHTNIKRAMKESGAVLAGETSGHYYFKDFSGADSALLALVHVLNIYANSRKVFSALMESYEVYFRSKEHNFKLSDSALAVKIFKKLRAKYKDGRQSLDDGLTVEYADWWFNARESKTEPVLRLNIEASAKTLLDEKNQELTRILDKLCNHR